jgi:hypothetical protein
MFDVSLPYGLKIGTAPRLPGAAVSTCPAQPRDRSFDSQVALSTVFCCKLVTVEVILDLDRLKIVPNQRSELSLTAGTLWDQYAVYTIRMLKPRSSRAPDCNVEAVGGLMVRYLVHAVTIPACPGSCGLHLGTYGFKVMPRPRRMDIVKLCTFEDTGEAYESAEQVSR